VLAECLGAAELVYLPAGIGAPGGRVHGEHVLVRDACLELRPDARLYADQPYCLYRPGLQLSAPLRDRYREARDILLTPPQRERKAEAIAAYGGEVPKLNRGFGICLTDPAILVRETFWQPALPERPSGHG
jgi:hypothetical protein